ncbi:MAG: acetoacetyl-CoA reductase, partial [Alphaproteobacteria bacterium]|nr:acetoacetyl-CoA reductase [Alphaproteobacteria bacterium]
MARIAVVTGGTRGIGAAICETLQKAEYKVAATYYGNEAAARKFTEKTGIPAYKFDVANFDACKEGVEKINADFGHIDVLVNNAGISRDSFLHKMTLQQWREVMSTNMDSVFNMSRLVIEGMRERCFGRIISVSSINAQSGMVGLTNYSAAKAAIIGFTKALALESASKGITVNAIAPGYVDTELLHGVSPEVMVKIVDKIPLKRLGKPEEIAAAVLYLASNQASFITGSTLTINGGQYLA